MGKPAVAPTDTPEDLGRLPEWMAENEPETGRVYFVHRNGFVKIGCSAALKSRLSSLTSYRDPDGGVGKVKLLLAVPGHGTLESYLKRRFADSSVDGYGEWFHATRDLMRFIARLRALYKNAGLDPEVVW